MESLIFQNMMAEAEPDSCSGLLQLTVELVEQLNKSIDQCTSLSSDYIAACERYAKKLATYNEVPSFVEAALLMSQLDLEVRAAEVQIERITEILQKLELFLPTFKDELNLLRAEFRILVSNKF